MVFSGLRLRVSTAQRIFCELEPLPRRPLNGHNKLVSSGTLPCGPDQVTSLPLFSLYVQGKCVHIQNGNGLGWKFMQQQGQSINAEPKGTPKTQDELPR